MKYTLLELVQTILSSMDSDEVNSINDTPEAQQVALVVRTAYYDLINRGDLPEHNSLITLDASGDATKPVLMTLPATVSEIFWMKYDKRELLADPINFDYVDYLPLEDFLHRMHMLSTNDTDVGSFEHTVGPDTFTIIYREDRHPSTYTTFDDNTVIFDSYNDALDTTLQKSKTLCHAKLVITFDLLDTFTPDLDEPQFSILLNEAKSLAWAELKQTVHGIAERNSKRGWNRIQSKKYATERTHPFDLLPNFGRK